ncbi:MAG: hypothetical protein HQK49_03510 [Oligoflexia bacterium]|nr:hypothetical protein [Oligoflexia bacterium]
MKLFTKSFIISLSLFCSLQSIIQVQESQAAAYGMGISSFPLSPRTGTLTTEYSQFISNGSGMGLQARYTYKLSNQISLEGGVGMADSLKSKRIFAATDIEFYPDLENMPRLSVKPFVERASEFNNTKNIIGVAPTASKGYILWGKTAYPFIALPMGAVLDSNAQAYNFRTHLALGLVGNLPLEGHEKLIVNLEGNLNIKNSSSALYLGLSYPLH